MVYTHVRLQLDECQRRAVWEASRPARAPLGSDTGPTSEERGEVHQGRVGAEGYGEKMAVCCLG